MTPSIARNFSCASMMNRGAPHRRRRADRPPVLGRIVGGDGDALDTLGHQHRSHLGDRTQAGRILTPVMATAALYRILNVMAVSEPPPPGRRVGRCGRSAVAHVLEEVVILDEGACRSMCTFAAHLGDAGDIAGLLARNDADHAMAANASTDQRPFRHEEAGVVGAAGAEEGRACGTRAEVDPHRLGFVNLRQLVSGHSQREHSAGSESTRLSMVERAIVGDQRLAVVVELADDGKFDHDGKPLITHYGALAIDNLVDSLLAGAHAESAAEPAGEGSQIQGGAVRLRPGYHTHTPLLRLPPTTPASSCRKGRWSAPACGCHGMVGVDPREQTGEVTGISSDGWRGRAIDRHRPSLRITTSSRTWATAPTSTADRIAVQAAVASDTTMTFKILTAPRCHDSAVGKGGPAEHADDAHVDGRGIKRIISPPMIRRSDQRRPAADGVDVMHRRARSSRRRRRCGDRRRHRAHP